MPDNGGQEREHRDDLPARLMPLIEGTLFEAVPCGIVFLGAIDQQIVVLYANRAALDLTGYSLADMQASASLRDVWQARYEDGTPLSEPSLVRQAFDGGHTSTGVVRQIVRADGDYRWLSLDTMPILAESGEVRYVALSMIDITAQHAVEQALRRSEENVRHLFSYTPFPMWVYERTTLRILEVNRAAVDAYGYTRDELLAMTIGDLRPPGDLSRLRAAVSQLAAMSIPPVTEWRHRTKDGRLIEVDVAVRPLHYNGASAMIAMIVDVTARKTIQREIERLHRYNNLLLASITEGIIGVDAQGNITFANAAACSLLGWEEMDLLQHPFHRRISYARADGSALPIGESPVQATLVGGAVHRVYGEVFWQASGLALLVDYTSTPVRRDDGGIEGAVIVFSSAAERLRLEESEALRRSEERLALHHLVGQHLAAARTLDAALPAILQTMGERMGWDLCQIWVPDAHDVALRPQHIWTNKQVDRALFERSYADLMLQRGVGMGGRVWQAGEPAWTLDMTRDPRVVRQDISVALNLHSGVWVPIVVHDEVLGVLEFVTTTVRPDCTDSIQTLVAIAGQMSQFVERVRAEAALEYQAYHDQLTHLPNRSYFERAVHSHLTHALHDGAGSALLLLDLDRFKEINDTFGHQYGDRVLQQVARRLLESVRGSDVLARLDSDVVVRLGGDEFALLLGDVTQEDAVHTAQRIRGTLEAPIIVDEQMFTVGGSIGVALAPEHGRDPETLLRCADVAMYLAKKTGVGVMTYSLENDQNRPDRLTLVADLRQAIRQGELTLHYQPQINLADGTLCGVEALSRWLHPTRGPIPPDLFVRLAEDVGLIGPLTLSVLRKALHQCSMWREVGMDVFVAVNVSMANLHDPSFVPVVDTLLQEFGVPPHLLSLEITESIVMADVAATLSALNALHALGVRLAIDDFGTGYSSLAYLRRLPVDELKIDRAFVARIASDPVDARIVATIAGLASSLALTVVAEGVEDAATYTQLHSLGCTTAQGYYISRPLDAASLERWMQAGSWRMPTLGHARGQAHPRAV